MLKHFIISILVSIILTTSVIANNNDSLRNSSKITNHIFIYSDWFRPFWADMHSSITRGEYAFALSSDEYNYGNKGGVYRPFIFSNLGVDLPIWSQHFKDKKYGFGVTLPFFIDVWMDFFERSTAPVVNTAYRFGSPEFIFIHRLKTPLWKFRNYSLKFTPMKHECTHIGDELTIYRKEENLSITRVNVSYNYWELGLTLNDPESSLKSNHSFRFSFMRLLNPKSEWYNIADNEGDISLIPRSKIATEWYIQYQYQTNVNKTSNLQGILSAEIRNRVKYGYPFFFKNNGNNPVLPEKFNSEYRMLNFNGMVGIRYFNPEVLKDYKVGAAFRFYLGQNPYGQFRSIPIYTQFGFCLLFER